MEDIFVPKSKPSDALVGPLHTVTYVTADSGTANRIFSEGYGLDAVAHYNPDGAELRTANAYLGFAPEHEWTATTYAKTGEGSNMQIRVIGLREETPLVRPTYEGLYKGGATMSFPIADLRAHEQRMLALGVESTMGVKEIEFTSPAGETYVSAEIVYKAPEFIFVMGVTRPDIFVPVGPMDPESGIGGPAYSARCIDTADETSAFFTEVLGYEIRRDMPLAVEGPSAINLPEGTEERFMQAFAPGASSGYALFMDHGDATKKAVTNFGPPNRGIVMWSFPTARLDEVYARAQNAGTEILHAPSERHSPCLPFGRTLLMKDPDGFPIEVFEVGD